MKTRVAGKSTNVYTSLLTAGSQVHTATLVLSP